MLGVERRGVTDHLFVAWICSQPFLQGVHFDSHHGVARGSVNFGSNDRCHADATLGFQRGDWRGLLANGLRPGIFCLQSRLIPDSFRAGTTASATCILSILTLLIRDRFAVVLAA